MDPHGGYFIDLVNQQMNCLFQDLSGQDLVKNMTPVVVVRCLGDDWVVLESNGERAAIQPLHEEIQQWLHKEALETIPEKYSPWNKPRLMSREESLISHLRYQTI